jgi:hypothetical protein
MVLTANSSDDWDDDDDEQGQCPECGAIVYLVGDKCPKCGYWFLEGDHRKMSLQSREKSEMHILKVIVVILIVASLIFGMIAAIVSSF